MDLGPQKAEIRVDKENEMKNEHFYHWTSLYPREKIVFYNIVHFATIILLSSK